MIYHILNGDGLAENFDLEGEIIVCREALIEGNIQSENVEDFWIVRTDFVKKTHGADDYFEKVKSEFDKFEQIKSSDEVNLWFGNEAFCQVNLWFCLYLLQNSNARIYRIFPSGDSWDCSFDNLENAFVNRKILQEQDLQLGRGLWNSLAWNESDYLRKLSLKKSECFWQLREVCQALIEKETKPKQILHEIIKNGETDFSKIFLQFKQKAAIYGYGDSQVKNILNTL